MTNAYPENRNVRFWLKIIYVIICLTAVWITLMTCIDIEHVVLTQEMGSEGNIFPDSVYIVFLSFFYVGGVLYVFLKWYYITDFDCTTLSVEDENMQWNMVTFFFISIVLFFFSLISDNAPIFIFVTMFSMQVFCSAILICFSYVNKQIS